jgi:tetratricopeptide (TPR) repeat protein
VLTDMAGANLDFLQAHPPLQPYAEAGLLDFAHFDAAAPADLRLLRSGETLSRAAATANPLLLFANYFFDSIPQDCFTVEGGEVFESLATVSSPQDDEPDLEDPGLLSRAKVKYKKQPAPPGYYCDPDLDQVLDAMRGRAEDTMFLLPTAGLACLRFFRDLSRGRLLLVAGDKGYTRDEDLPGLRAPHIAKHGSISLMVNYPALGHYVQNHGGRTLTTAHRHANLHVSAFLLGDPPQGYVETAQAYEEAFEQGGPDDLFTLKKGVEKHAKDLSLEELLAILRLSGWDNRTFNDYYEALLAKTGETGDDELKEEVRRAAANVWDNYYNIGEDEDLPFDLGRLLYTADGYKDALAFFERSLADYGPAMGTYYNMGLCHYQLGNLATALNLVEQSLVLDPAFKPAQQKRAQIRSDLGRAD